MEHLKLLKAQLTILKAIPDYYDIAEALLTKVSHVEREVDEYTNVAVSNIQNQHTNYWIGVIQGNTQYVVFDGKGYKVQATVLETIPQGAHTLFVTRDK